MRLSAELIETSEQRTNALGERELVLRGLGISVLEHLGAARDDFDAWDLSRNRLVSVENLPRVKRLSTLLCGSNAIETVNLKSSAPNLQHLVLSDNRVSNLAQVKSIGQSCPNLQTLCLDGNPITRQQHYRLYTILQNPNLKVLDYIKVKKAEREKAQRLGKSAAGAALEEDIKTFEPGEGLSNGGNTAAAFTDEEKAQIRELLANASSTKEVEEIEAAVANGVLPSGVKASKRQKVI